MSSQSALETSSSKSHIATLGARDSYKTQRAVIGEAAKRLKREAAEAGLSPEAAATVASQAGMAAVELFRKQSERK